MADTDKLVEAIQQLIEILKAKSGAGTKSSAIAAGTTAEEQLEAERKAYENLNDIIKATNDGKERQAKLDENRLSSLNKYKSVIEEALKIEVQTNGIRSPAAQRYISDLKTINAELDKEKNSLTEINKKTKELTGNILEMGKETIKTGLNLRNAFKPQDIAAAVKAFDAVDAATAKATGAGRRYTQQILDSQSSLAKYGVTLEQTGQGYSKAATNLFLFNSRSESFQKAIVSQATRLEKLGVSQEQFYKNTNTMNAVLGMTADKSTEVQENLIGMANALGMSTTEVNNNLISNMNRLSIYGKDTINQFSKLQIYAKTTNLEMGTLTDLTEKLSTFEGAGEFAGRLNAMAGMDLFDVGELVSLEGADKIQYIIEKVQQAGFDLDDPKIMRAVSQASGLDAGTFRSLANMSGDKLRKAIEQTQVETGKGVEGKVLDTATAEEQRKATEEKLQAQAFGGKAGLQAYRSLNAGITAAMDALGGKIMFLGGTILALAGSMGLGSKIMGGLKEIGGSSLGNVMGKFKSPKGMPDLKSVSGIAGEVTEGASTVAKAAETGADFTKAADVVGKVAEGGDDIAKSGGFLSKFKFFDKLKSAKGFFSKIPFGKLLAGLGVVLDPILGGIQIAGMLNNGDPKDPALRQEIGKKIISTAGNTLLNALALIPPIAPVAGTLSFLNGIGGIFGFSAGDLLASMLPNNWVEGIGGYVADKFGTPGRDEKTSKDEKKILAAEPFQDGFISPNGGPIIKTDAGKLLQGSAEDSIMLINLKRAISNNSGRNMDMSAIQAIANRPIIIQIDGREIAKVSNKEFTPRYA
jgi:hypothetical protein